MPKVKQHKRSFKIREGNFADAYAFAKSLLDRKDVSRQTAMEALLVFEALMQRIVDTGLDEDADLEILGQDKLGDYQITIAFEGDVFVLDADAADSMEERVLGAYNDKIVCNYYLGFNEISISVNRNNRTSMFACMVAALCAVVAFIPLIILVDAGGRENLLANYVFPLERLYANTALMVGAPMTFFSLLKNLTDTYVLSRRNSGMRQIQMRTIATSLFAIALAFVSFSILSIAMAGIGGLEAEFGGSFDRSFGDVVISFVPSNIFEPFEAISPIPLIVLALLFTYAMCSAGKYFNALRQAMMACYTLFSRILHLLIAALPPFCFLAVLDALLESGAQSVIVFLAFFLSSYLGIAALFISYAVRLRAHGIKPIPFARQLAPLVRENMVIGSAIDAAPYNIRYCLKVFGIDRKLLERTLPVLAETNLDGNCFILMFFSLMFTFLTGTELSLVNLVVLAGMVLFLSVGAPNQAGSILIGALIITMYLNSFEVVCMAIVAEMLLGGAQNLVNVLGDIVIVAIEDRKAKG